MDKDKTLLEIRCHGNDLHHNLYNKYLRLNIRNHIGICQLNHGDTVELLEFRRCSLTTSDCSAPQEVCAGNGQLKDGDPL